MAIDKILEVFFKNPKKRFHIRQISRDLGISKTTVAYHINNLVKNGVLLKDIGDIFPGYKANNSKSFKIKKITYLLKKLDEKKLDSLLENLESKKTKK